MNTLDEMIEVLQAMKEGKAIEVKPRTDGNESWRTWNPSSPTRLDFAERVYRVKKEPMVIWGVVYADGSVYSSKNKIYAEDRYHNSPWPDAKLVKFVEVAE